MHHMAADGVHVVGRGDDHRVDVLAFLVEHLAEVAEARRVGEALEGRGGAAVVHVAQRHDVLRRGGGAEIRSALAAGADGGEIQFLVRRFVAHCLQEGALPNPAAGTAPASSVP